MAGNQHICNQPIYANPGVYESEEWYRHWKSIRHLMTDWRINPETTLLLVMYTPNTAFVQAAKFMIQEIPFLSEDLKLNYDENDQDVLSFSMQPFELLENTERQQRITAGHKNKDNKNDDINSYQHYFSDDSDEDDEIKSTAGNVNKNEGNDNEKIIKDRKQSKNSNNDDGNSGNANTKNNENSDTKSNEDKSIEGHEENKEERSTQMNQQMLKRKVEEMISDKFKKELEKYERRIEGINKGVIANVKRRLNEEKITLSPN